VIKFFVILLFLLSSCAYPDIDTTPDFKDVIITDEDSIELCKINNPYNSPSKVLISVVPVPTYRYISNNYKRLKCFEVLDINTNRYGL
jgi:hypothetical protein